MISDSRPCDAGSEPGRPPLIVTDLKKDGSFRVDSKNPNEIARAKSVFFDNTLYKAAYRQQLSELLIVGFFARGIKTYDNRLLLGISTSNSTHIFVFKCPADPTTTPKILNLDSTYSGANHFGKLVPDAQQILLTESCLVFLGKKTYISNIVNKK